MSPRVGLDTQAVLDAAAQIADSEGIDSVTLRRVSSELGVRSPSLYNHVDGLAGLRRGLHLRGLRMIAADLRIAAVGVIRHDALAAICHAQRAMARAHPGLYAAIQPSVHREDVDQELAAAGLEVLQVLEAVLRSYGIGGDDAIHAIRGLRSAVHGFITLEAAGAFGMAQDVEESFDRLIVLLAEGFQSRGSRGSP